MKSDNFFLYDAEECRFIKAEYRLTDKIVHYACMWILCGVVLGGAAVAVMSSIVGSPAEIALQAENNELLQQLKEADQKVGDFEQEITQLSEWDKKLYRSMMGLPPISDDERMAGVGGADIFSRFDIFSEPAAHVLKSLGTNLEMIEHRLSIQKKSFEEILEAHSANEARLEMLPVIKPVSGLLISHYGMRVHPIYKMRRMHSGIDFKADRGTPVYAAGNGTIAYASRQSGYGNLIRLDHSEGMESVYAHLNKFADGIKPGKKVKRGDLIGYVGSTGLSQAPHLHFEIRIDGESVNPLDFLALDVDPEEYRRFIAQLHPDV